MKQKAAALVLALLLLAGCVPGGWASAGFRISGPSPDVRTKPDNASTENASAPPAEDVPPSIGDSTPGTALPEGSDDPASPENGFGSSDPAAGGTPAPQASTPTVSASGTYAPSSAAGALRVVGTHLVDSSGRTVQLRGISTHGLAWYPGYVNEACFKQLHDEWGVNVIRLAMYTTEYGGYCTGGDQAALKKLIRNGVRYAANQGMYVIIDWHILSDGDPNTYLNQAKAFFDEVSAEYAGYSNVLYEICNEPNGGTSWSRIKSYAEQIIPVIRANDPDAVILVGTPNWSQYVDQAAADPIRGYDNIMYTLHFYAATHTDGLRNKMVAAVNAGLPIFVSEYGICDASGSGAINETQANLWVEAMDRYGISYVAWNLSNKSETSAILNTSCTRTSGFAQSDLSASGKWLYRMLTGKGGTGTQAPVVPSTPSPTPSPSAAPTPSAGSTIPGAVTWTGGGLEITAELRNSWEADGKPVRQYALTVRNTSGSAISSWAVDVPFGGSFTFLDGWNGDFTVNRNTLHITSKDYNGTLAPGASTGDIGFIVSGRTIAG